MASDKRGESARADVPKGFTLGLALVDGLPVVLFCVSAIVLGMRLKSPLFVAGSVVALVAGACKVAWKLVIALAHKSIPALSRQMRYVMPVGFALMATGIATSWGSAAETLSGLATMPSAALLAIWVACMAAMAYLAGHRDQTSARDNWVEQGVNSLGQAALLAALLLAG